MTSATEFIDEPDTICNELRDKAQLFEGYQNGEISDLLREAADTIEGLRERELERDRDYWKESFEEAAGNVIGLDHENGELRALVRDMHAELDSMRDDVFLMDHIEKRMSELGIGGAE